MRSNPVCPVCGANLVYRKESKDFLVISLQEDGSIVIDENESDTSTEVYCSEDRTHKIGSITYSRVEQIICPKKSIEIKLLNLHKRLVLMLNIG